MWKGYEQVVDAAPFLASIYDHQRCLYSREQELK
jgi:hypothetical protein